MRHKSLLACRDDDTVRRQHRLCAGKKRNHHRGHESRTTRRRPAARNEERTMADNKTNEKLADKSIEKQPSSPSTREPFLPALVHSGAELAQKTSEAAFGALRDVHTEVFTRTSSTIDFVDELQQGSLRLLRRVVARVDHLTLAVISAGEHVSTSTVFTGKNAVEGVNDLVSRTADAVAGAKRAA
jgi:hypothetical protein